MKKQITQEKAYDLFRENGGVLRTKEVIKLGINPKTLYSMRESGIIKPNDRGIYLLVDDEILNYAKICRVSNIISPYIDTIING